MNYIINRLLVFVVAFLTSCGGTSTPKDQFSTNTNSNISIEESTGTAEVKLTNFSMADVARFTLSSFMGQPSKKIKVVQKDGLYNVTYTRKSDLQKFSYNVKMKGNRVIWAPIDGRWRDGTGEIGLYDEIINFEERGKKLIITITYSDGSSSVKEFKNSD